MQQRRTPIKQQNLSTLARERIRNQFMDRIRKARSQATESNRFSSPIDSRSKSVSLENEKKVLLLAADLDPLGLASLIRDEFNIQQRNQDDWFSFIPAEQAIEIERQLLLEAVQINHDFLLSCSEPDQSFLNEDAYLDELVNEQNNTSSSNTTTSSDSCFLCNQGILLQTQTFLVQCNNCAFSIGTHDSPFTLSELKSKFEKIASTHAESCAFQLIPLFTVYTGLTICCTYCERYYAIS